MKGALALRQAVQTVSIDMSSTNVTTSAYLELIAALSYGASAVEVINNSASPMKLSVGAAGSEASFLVPYTIPPGGTPGLIPHAFKAGARISVEALIANVTSGSLILNFFG